MKKFLIICAVVVAVSACNNDAAKSTAAGGDTTKAGETKMADAKMPEMPFPMDRPYSNWQPGDPQHAVTVMKALKAFTEGDINACMDGFGDSVRVGFDNFQTKLSKDSLKASFTQWRATYAKITIKMDDWESVISSDKKDEWVTLWYKEYHTDKKGGIDSIGVVDDCKIVNGKVVVLDEKTQKLGPPKK
jgi:hypothetical protein